MSAGGFPYKSQATVGDLLRIETEPIRVGSSSLVVAQTIRQAGSGCRPVLRNESLIESRWLAFFGERIVASARSSA